MVTKRVKKPAKVATIVTDNDKEMASAILAEARRIDEEREVPKDQYNTFVVRRNIATYNLYKCRYMALSPGVRSEISRIAGKQNAKVNKGKPKTKKISIEEKPQTPAEKCLEELKNDPDRLSFIEEGEKHE